MNKLSKNYENIMKTANKKYQNKFSGDKSSINTNNYLSHRFQRSLFFKFNPFWSIICKNLYSVFPNVSQVFSIFLAQPTHLIFGAVKDSGNIFQ